MLCIAVKPREKTMKLTTYFLAATASLALLSLLLQLVDLLALLVLVLVLLYQM